jgi:hypothetical protein
MTAASQASSLSGMPENIGSSSDTKVSRRDVRQIRPCVHHAANRVTQDRNAGAGLDGLGRDVAAERTRLARWRPNPTFAIARDRLIH